MSKQSKRNILSRPQSFWIEPPGGLVAESLAELKYLLNHPLYPSKFPVSVEEKQGIIWLHSMDFRSGLELGYRLRTARDLWWVIKDIRVGSFKELTKAFSQCSWQDVLSPNACPQIEVKSYQSKLYHEGKIRDLLQQHLMGLQFNQKVSSEKLMLRQTGNRLTISVSMGGIDLYKRGFKVSLQAKAPLSEHLAAGLLQPFHQTQFDEILVPFAGSGTLGFESLLMLGNVAPAQLGRSYALETMELSPKPTLKFLRQKLDQGQQKLPALTLIEISQQQTAALLANREAFTANLGSQLSAQIIQGDAFSWNPEHLTDKRILLPLNPPYGLRLSQGQSSQGFYARLGTWIHSVADSCRQLKGFSLCPDEKTYKVLRHLLRDIYTETRHINQGGRHVRALYFSTCDLDHQISVVP